MPLILGQQRALERQYQIRRQGLLLEREALMGDYDRAVRRAEAILELEREQRREERENQRLAIQIMMDAADREERLMLSALERALDRAEKVEERDFLLARQELDDIRSFMAAHPLETSRYVAKYGWPRTFDELVRGVGEFMAPRGELRTVPGVGVVRIPEGAAPGEYEVIVPEGVAKEDKEYWKNLVSIGAISLQNVPQNIRAEVGEELRREGRLANVPHEWTDEEIRQAIYACLLYTSPSPRD